MKRVHLSGTRVGHALGGRRHTDKSSGDSYGDGLTVKDLLPEITKVKYEKLDLSHLYITGEKG
ncbi:MAG: hypothetical protein H6912_10240 [Kordiimonadaceae bacterium]|nr:hypothetical protein [Kordiimonadaceae bacterium]